MATSLSSCPGRFAQQFAAERNARDADMAVAIAEDLLRRARLELLNALGRFP